MNIRRTCYALCLALLVPGLSGCATIAGSPRRLLDETASMGLVNRHPMDGAITKFARPDTTQNNDLYRDGLTRQQYRDMVVIIYMNAMDSRYYEFRSALSSERRQADFALDLAVLGFTGWASVARESIVNNLSAVAAGFAGARNSVDRNLYFDRTLPALISAMDAQRLRARAQMMINLRKSAGDYPLPTAFADLMSYEVSSTLDTAIGQITGDAAQDRQAAQRELAAAATPACRADEGAAAVQERLFLYIDRYAPNADTGAISANSLMKLVRIAGAIEVPAGWTTPDTLYRAIQDRLSAGQGGLCRTTDLEAFVTRISTATGENF